MNNKIMGLLIVLLLSVTVFSVTGHGGFFDREHMNISHLDSAYEPPINIFIDIHIEPMENGPSYLQRRAEVNWLRESAVDYGAKLSLQSNGEYMEFCIENNHQNDLRRYLSEGFDVGTHTHLYTREAPHLWVPHYNEVLTFSLLNKIISDNKFFVDRAIGPENNICLCTHSNNVFLDEIMAIHNYLYLTGPGEEGYFEFGHMVWNPFRPSTDKDYPLKENTETDFITIPHLPQIGKPDSHGMNLLVPQLKRRFLMCYIEWMNRVRNHVDDKIWVWGFATHAGQNFHHRDEIEEMLSWLNNHFILEKDPYGNTIAVYASASEIYGYYTDWEKNNPGASSFNYVNGNSYPYTYEAMPLILENASYDKKIDIGQNVNVYRLLKDERYIYIIWTNQGCETIDFRDEIRGKLKCTDGHGNSFFQFSQSLKVSEEPLFIEFSSKSYNLFEILFHCLVKWRTIF